MRDYDKNYGYADVINRRARWGVLLIVAVVFAFAYATNAMEDGDEENPSVTVLSAELLTGRPATDGGLTAITVPPTQPPAEDQPEQAPLAVIGDTTTTVPATTTSTAPAAATSTTTTSTSSTSTTVARTTTTTRVPPPTTSTTRVPPTTSTTVSSTTTTTVRPPTTTLPPPTTTTTLPSTTTTTTVPAIDTIHIHELKGDDRGDDEEPYARIEVKVRNQDGDEQEDVQVLGRFSGGYTGIVSGTTDDKGRVRFESGTVEGDSVTFTVLNLVHTDYVYAPEENRRGPSVTVEFD